MTVLIAILGLALLVLVHEAGHFFVARAVGMRPRRFYIGFPPPLVRVRRGGIEYGIGAIPLGGYVKIPGMHRPAPADVDTYFGRAVAEEPDLNAPAAALRRRFEEGDMEGAKGALEALRAAIGEARLSAATERLAERGLNELGDALGGDAYWRQAVWRRIVVIAAGPATNVAFAVLLFAGLFMVGSGAYRLGFSLKARGDHATPVVADVLKGHPAARAGLRPGDRILAVNGHRVRPDRIAHVIGTSHGRPLALSVERRGTRVTLPAVRPRKDAGESPPVAAWDSIKLTGEVTKEIGLSFGRLFHNRKEISSTVGIVQGSSSALREGVRNYLWVLGLISLSLALLNLLPLLPLDGGHIAFSIVEGIRGRAVGREVYERVSALGIAFVLFLFFVGLSNDIGRLSGG